MKLDEIKRLIEAATPGPWHSVRAAMKDSFVPCRARVVAHDKAQENPELLVEVPSYSHRPEHDAAFIAASRTLMPKLLAVAEAAMALGNALTPEERASQALFPEYRNLKDAIAALEAE